MQTNIPDDQITAAGVLVISSDNKILAFARRGDRTKLGLPAGKREAGEDLLQAAARELFEETGIVIELDNSNEVFVYQPDDKQAAGISEYCATFIKHIDQLSTLFTIQEANKDEHGAIEGFGLWVTPAEFIESGSSAFLDYNTNLLKSAKLIG